MTHLRNLAHWCQPTVLGNIYFHQYDGSIKFQETIHSELFRTIYFAAFKKILISYDSESRYFFQLPASTDLLYLFLVEHPGRLKNFCGNWHSLGGGAE